MCMGIYFGCCRSSKRKKEKMPIVSNEFFAPMAMPAREPRLPVLPPTPVNTAPSKEPHMSRPEMDGGSEWPLRYSGGASPVLHPAPPPVALGAAGGDYGPKYKHDPYRGASPPPPVHHAGYVGQQGGYVEQQGYVEGVAYGDPGAHRNPEWDYNREGTVHAKTSPNFTGR